MPNKLIDQSSPYLLQHANNPVDWHPWNDQSLELARAENKPILLSIGYAACHWCHVMEKESFENEEIATIMNSFFVCIKVDREERPDLDKIYQLAHQMLTQRPGGWPLTVALTPHGHAPFFAGTYFPPTSRSNMLGFGELLQKIFIHYQENQEKMSDYLLSFNTALEKLNPSAPASTIADPVAVLDHATGILDNQFDTVFGGFGSAPKFPHPTQLELLMVAAARPTVTSPNATVMVEKTLTRMAQGGLYDHLAGGFFRYSVDREWKIPHFEKMLYDNAQLLVLYSHAWQVLPKPLYRNAATSTAQWVIDEMQQPGGGYASTLDADSEGEEGKYYVWSETDLCAVLSEDEYTQIENTFGLFGEANFEGRWHLNLNPDIDHELPDQNSETDQIIRNAKSRLLEIRRHRIRPGLDDKILTAWNGLMISGMALAGRIFNCDSFIESAQQSVDFIRNNLWQGNRLLASCAKGKSHLNGYLDDYSFMLCGILQLLQSKWRQSDLEFAVNIADAMIDRFEDTEGGGFYFTSHDHEKLLYRPKTGADDAIPSGNGLAISGLLGLGYLMAETRYLQTAEKALAQFSDELQRHPSINASMSIALQKFDPAFSTVIIRGKRDDMKQWSDYINQKYIPGLQCFAIPDSIGKLPPSLAIYKSQPGTTAYVCKGNQCSPPFTDLKQLREDLS